MRREIEPPDPRVRDGTGAHGAGLEGHPQVATLQPFAAAQRKRCLQGEQFGVAYGAAVPPHPVLSHGKDRTVGIGHSGGNRHLAGGGGGGRFFQKKRHNVGARCSCCHDRLVAQPGRPGKSEFPHRRSKTGICQAPVLRVTPAA